MAKNVRFVQTTKQKWLNRDTYDLAALYFCVDTGEIFKGNVLFTEGVKIVPTRDDLPSFECAADGVVYYITDTKAGFMISPDRTEWLQTIYAPVADVTSIPEGEEYNVVTTVGAVRDIEKAIYKYIDEEIANVEISGGQDGQDGKDGVGISSAEVNEAGELVLQLTNDSSLNVGKVVGADGKDGIDGVDGQNGVDGKDGKTPYIQDGYWYIDGVNTNVKAEGVDGKDGTNGLNGKDGADGKDGQNGQDGKDGKGISAITKTSTNGLIDTYCITFSDGATTYFDVTNGKDGVNGQDGAPGKDGVDGVDGAPGKDGIDGKDGETPTVEISDDGYWVINGTKTEHKAIGVDGKDGADGKNGVDGTPGADGKDGNPITKSEINANGELVFTLSDGSTVNVGRVVGTDGADGSNGTDGKDGEDGVGIQTVEVDENGNLVVTLTSGTALDLGNIKGADGKDGADGTPGKDGANGTDGTDGKDGESAYEIWLNAGHSGSEADFLQWLKADNEPFGDVIASISCGGIEAGTSLKDKTVKDVLIMLLGIQEASQSVVEYIMENQIPAYSGTMSGQTEAVEYQLLDATTANYADQGFYTATDEEGNITNAGYQFTIDGNGNADAQVIAMSANAVITMAYRYDLGGTNTWLAYTFDLEDEANYWLLGDTFTETVNGEEVVYQTYVYNIDVVGGGDAITNTEYWRFEIEVTN